MRWRIRKSFEWEHPIFPLYQNSQLMNNPQEHWKSTCITKNKCVMYKQSSETKEKVEKTPSERTEEIFL